MNSANAISTFTSLPAQFRQFRLALAREWAEDPAVVKLLSEEDYIGLVADFIERLSPEILLQRLGSEVPPKMKLAPHWNLRLHELAPRVSAELARRDSWHGCRYEPATFA